MVNEVTALDELLDTLATTPNTVVFFARRTGCAPCRALAPHYEAASERVDGVEFLKVYVDEVPETIEEFNLMSVPDVRRYTNGLPDGSVEGRTVAQLIAELS